MQINSGAAFLHALSRATEPRPAAFADRLAELQQVARAAKAANAANVAAQRAAQPSPAPAAPAQAQAQAPLSPPAPGLGPVGAPGQIKPRGSLLNIVV
jgi:hypothetical protein